MYGLNTPTSDIDHRGIFCNTEPAQILGLSKHAEQRKQDADSDEVYYEIRRWMELLRKSNTEAVDTLFTTTFVGDVHPIIIECQANYSRLFCSKRLFNSILGYSISELRLAIGERTGLLGSKRRESLEKYGFSPKNFVQLFRLYHVATAMIRENRYILDCTKEPYFERLMEIKTNPSKFNKEQLKTDADRCIHDMRNLEVMVNKNAFAAFDEEYANQILHRVYKEFIV